MFNFWQSMSGEFQAELNALVQGGEWEEETAQFPLLVNLDPVTLRLYRRVVGASAIDKNFVKWDAPNGRRLRTWSIYTDRPEDVPQVRSDFDAMESAYQQDFNLTGMWDWDGRPAGMQWVDEADHNQGVTGTPLYGTPQAALNFMPDVKIPGPGYPDDPSDYTTEPPVTMADVHLLYGQEPRIFVYDDGAPWEAAMTNKEILEQVYSVLVVDHSVDPCDELLVLLLRMIRRMED